LPSSTSSCHAARDDTQNWCRGRDTSPAPDCTLGCVKRCARCRVIHGDPEASWTALPLLRSDPVDQFGRAERFGNCEDAIDLCAGHQGLAAPDEPYVQIALVAVLLQMIHDAGQVIVDVWTTKMVEEARKRSFQPCFEATKIVAAELGVDGVAIGAALLARDAAE